MARRFGIARIGQPLLSARLQSLGRLVVAERFAAPAELAAISLPAPRIDPKGGPIRIVLLDPRDGAFRTALLETIRPGVELPFGFSAFANAEGAPFLLFLFQPATAEPVTLGRWQRLMLAWLLRRPMITLRCNERVAGFDRLRLPPGPANALHLLPDPDEPRHEPAKLRGAVEAYWQEDGGCYVQGWLHAYERPVLGAAIASPDGASIALERLAPRPDLKCHYPMLPGAVPAAGFRAFVPGHAGSSVTLLVETEAGRSALALPLSERSMPPAAALEREAADKEQAFVRFVTEVNERGLEVLEVGSRLVGSRTEPLRARFPRASRYVGMDIHPGSTVDLVGDVHALSALVGRQSFDAVFSGAVFEHLAMPWLAAVEINRVLRPGGLTFHITPQAWPVHEEPNDFWRFTDEALKLLFGEPFGFEVLSAGMADRVRLYPLDKGTGDLGLPFGYGYASAWVLARKTRDIKDAGPGPGDLSALGRRYPVKAG